MPPLDVLAIVAHRDDAELLCGGTLIAAHDLGRATGVLDLSAGETGTRGSVALRGAESEKASAIMGLEPGEGLERGRVPAEASFASGSSSGRWWEPHSAGFAPRGIQFPYIWVHRTRVFG